MTVLSALAEWVAHVALAAVQVLSWLGVGSLVFRRFRTGLVAVDRLNELGAGAVAFALATFAAGLAGLLYAAIFVPVTIAAAAVGTIVLVRTLRGRERPRLRTLPRWQLALAAAIAVVAALALVATGAPVSGYDALTYHVSVPVLYEERGEFFEVPWSWSSYQPFSVEMLITDGLLLWDPVQGAFAPLALVGAATAAVAVGGSLVGGAPLGLLAAAIFLGQPLVAWEGTAALVEGGLAFAVALTALNLLVWVRSRRPTALVAAGIFAGAAAGMKYIGLFAVLAATVAVALAAHRGSRAASLAGFVLPAVVVASPWYAKNWILTGNPLFPFLFGGVSERFASELRSTLGEYGFGRSPLDLLLLPVRLVSDGDAFDGSDWLSPLLLVFPPLALLDRRVRRGVLIALAACAVYVGCWFMSSQQARFLIPIVPVLVVAAALGLQAVARAGRVGRVVAPAAVAGALALGLAIFAVYCAQFFPVVAGLETKEQFLSERTAYYDGVAWLNRELDESDGVLIDFPSPYLDPRYVVWTPLVLPREASPEAVRRFVRTNRLRYAAVLGIYRGAHSHHLRALGARHVATVDVHTAYLGLRRWGGVPHRLFVYRLPNRPG